MGLEVEEVVEYLCTESTNWSSISTLTPTPFEKVDGHLLLGKK